MRNPKNCIWRVMIATVVTFTALPVWANSELVIESLDSAGELVFGEITNATSYRVEWASAPGGPWHSFSNAAQTLDEIAATGTGSVTSSVPMFYRVVADVISPPPDFVISSSGSSAYLINGESNPVLNLVRGQTYTISIDASGHPFWIKTTATTGTGDQFNNGVTNNGASVGDIVFTVPLDAPDTLYYICQFHGAMQGTILISDASPPVPDSMVLIPSGTNEGTNPLADEEQHYNSYPATYSLTVDSFYMDKYPVTKALWDEVYTWAITNGYSFDNVGSGKGTNHPVHTVNWYDVVKWCNARSEMEGRPPVYTADGVVYKTGQNDNVVQTSSAGYRLPTSDEWEYAARGGLSSRRFPWGDEINHDYANYYANASAFSYDTSPYTSYTYHPTYYTGGTPYTSPVGSFAANGYGLYDMAGNVLEWSFTPSGLSRSLRGGRWPFGASSSRVGFSHVLESDRARSDIGFRAVLSTGPAGAP